LIALIGNPLIIIDVYLSLRLFQSLLDLLRVKDRLLELAIVLLQLGKLLLHMFYG
jgi:hypothetical protein